jgi:hypothetical protein
MKLDDPAKVLTWLRHKPSQQELRAAFPAEWDAMEKELAAAISERDPTRLNHLLRPSNATLLGTRKTTLGRRDKWTLVQSAVTQRMAALAIERFSAAAAAGRVSGKFRFNLFNGMLAQRLLFARGFERKPVSLFWFKLLWPLIWQKRFLMPLVERKGIYCFYSRELIAQLAAVIAGRSTLEIGAGDGTLTRFLAEQGVTVTASDDHSWADRIDYPESVVRMDAQSALRHFCPQVVICSWPPSQNTFEREVFQTASVELYVVILSQHQFATGNWRDYQTQSEFQLEQRADWRELVLPPELGSEVLLFRRPSP